MKKIITLTAALLLGISAFADDNDFYLYYDSSTTDKVNQELAAVNTIQKITFEKGNIVLTKKDGNKVTTAISAVKRLFFSTPHNVGITTPEVDMKVKRGEVYDLTGRKLNIKVDQKLPKGIYIVDGKKVMVK